MWTRYGLALVFASGTMLGLATLALPIAVLSNLTATIVTADADKIVLLVPASSITADQLQAGGEIRLALDQAPGRPPAARVEGRDSADACRPVSPVCEQLRQAGKEGDGEDRIIVVRIGMTEPLPGSHIPAPGDSATIYAFEDRTPLAALIVSKLGWSVDER